MGALGVMAVAGAVGAFVITGMARTAGTGARFSADL